MSEEYLYLPQIQFDWQLSLVPQTTDKSTPDKVKLKGHFGKTVDITLPQSTDDISRSFWLNLLRFEGRDSPEVLSTTIMVNGDHPDALTLTSPAVDVSYDNDTKTVHLHKDKDGSTLIDSRVHPPLHHDERLHPGKPLYEGNHKVKRNDDDTGLLPGDLDSDDGIEDGFPSTTDSSNITEYNDQVLTSTALNDATKIAKKRMNLPRVNTLSINKKHQVISGDDYNNIQLWDLDTGDIINTIGILPQPSEDQQQQQPQPQQQQPLDIQHSCHVGPVTSVKWLSNDVLFLSGSLDTTLKLWSPEYPSSSLRTYTGHQRGIVDLYPLEHVQLFLSIGLDGKLIFWNPQNTTPANVLDLTPQQDSEKILTSIVAPSMECITQGKATIASRSIVVTHSLGFDVIDYTTKTIVRQVKTSYRISCGSFISPNLLLVGGDDGMIALYHIDHDSFNSVFTRRVAEDTILHMAYHHDTVYLSTFQGDMVSYTHPILTNIIQSAKSGQDVTHQEQQQITKTESNHDDPENPTESTNTSPARGTFPHVFSGTDQPLYDFSLNSDNRLVAVGVDGVLIWRI